MTTQRRNRRATLTEQRLAGLALFAGCNRRELAMISAWTTEVALPAGASLCRERVTAPQFVIVLEGQVELSRAGRPAGTVTGGGWFGDRSLIEERTEADITAVAYTSTRLLVFSRREFHSLLHLTPALTAVLDARTPILDAPTRQPQALSTACGHDQQVRHLGAV